METYLSYKCSSAQKHFKLQDFAASSVSLPRISENDTLNGRGRSIAHMLPPIKPALLEVKDESPFNNSTTARNSEQPRTFASTKNALRHNVSDWNVLDLSRNASDKNKQQQQQQHQQTEGNETVNSVKSWLDHISNGRTSHDPRVLEDNTNGSNSSANPEEKIPVKNDSSPEKTSASLADTKASIHEFASTYKDLDTHVLARKVKDILVENNIGQRIFGQAVLGLTQGSVSDLLSHPKSWKSLSLKGREPFIRMRLWLDNPKNIEQLKSIKTEKQLDNAVGISKITTSSSGRCVPSSKKKSRVVLSTEEKLVLLQTYSSEPYPSHSTVEELARKLNKKSSTIINWFHNYRSRVKRGFFSCEDQLVSECGKTVKKELASSDNLDTNTEVLSEVQPTNPTSIVDSKDPAITNGSAVEVKGTSSGSDLGGSNPMVITATVLLTSSSHTVTPMFSFRVPSGQNALTPMYTGDALKTLLLRVYSPRKLETPPSSHPANPVQSHSTPPANTLLTSCTNDDDVEIVLE